MTRLIKDSKGNFNFEDRFLWFWLNRTAQDKAGNDLPCLLIGFSTLQEAFDNAQSDFYIHKSCFNDLKTLKDIIN